MSHLVAYVDGGSRGNPGPAAIGIIIDHPEGQRVRIAKSIGHQDNNVAEYVALLERRKRFESTGAFQFKFPRQLRCGM